MNILTCFLFCLIGILMWVRPLPVQTPQAEQRGAVPQQQPQGNGTPRETRKINQASNQQQRQGALLQQQAQDNWVQPGSQAGEIIRDDFNGASMDGDKWVAGDVLARSIWRWSTTLPMRSWSRMAGTMMLRAQKRSYKGRSRVHFRSGRLIKAYIYVRRGPDQGQNA